MTDQEARSLSEVTGTLTTRGYNLIRKLGEGTYAKVYLATYVPTADPNRKTILACKVVDTTKAPKDFVRKFLPRELDILMKVNHPHIVHVHSIFQRRSKYYIFMRLAENGDLLDWVLKHGAVSEGQSRVWLRQLSLALQYLQELDIAHRDLKCENVLISANYNVKLADFGFARYVVDTRGKRVLSSTNCGSLSYAAPEILRGEQYDPKISDIWSLGVVLYIMLNKAMPFDDTNINRLYDEQMHRRWKFCSTVVDVLSEQVKKLVYNLLEPDVQKRYRVDQILSSDWLAMDPRLAVSTRAEVMALAAAVEERLRRFGAREREGKPSNAQPNNPSSRKQRETARKAEAPGTSGGGALEKTEFRASENTSLLYARTSQDNRIPSTNDEVVAPTSKP